VAGRIVVGVDGSDQSIDALRWAAEEAKLRDATLVAVHAWMFSPPVAVGTPDMMAMPAGNIAEELDLDREMAERALSGSIETALGAAPEVSVEPLLVEDTPGEGLVTAAEGADLLVVGTHGRGRIAQALLGSVSHHAAQHATCPVVIVRHRED
jgi:nucleotide-binding universal stress UspA family protein